MAFILVSFLVRFFFVIALGLSFCYCSIVHQITVFGLSQLKLEFLDFFDVVFLLDLMLKNFMILIFDDFLHFELFFLELLVFGVNIDDGSFEG